MASNLLKTPHVLILGGGLGGLALTQAPREKGITFEVYHSLLINPQILTVTHGLTVRGGKGGCIRILDDFHASMPDDMAGFEQVNHFLPFTLPA
ncbi:salicylate hydroxylase [Microdochium nivale]|nr:salicylate hydroxylase [Microdochium nivale]